MNSKKSRAFSTECIFVLSDTHFVAPVDGVPARFCHDPKALSVALQIMGDRKPDRIIHAGDLCEMPLVSPHSGKRNEEGQVWGVDGKLRAGLLENDIDLGKAFWEYVCSAHPKAKKDQLEGNHDIWVHNKLLRPPFSQFGDVGIRGIKWADYGVNFHRYDSEAPWVDLGQVCVMHGHGNASGSAMVNQHDNVVHGHSHKITYIPNDKNHREKRRAWGIGALCGLWAEYCSMGGAQNGWTHGFGVIYRRGDQFSVRQVEVLPGYVVPDFDGKTYGAKPLKRISPLLEPLEVA